MVIKWDGHLFILTKGPILNFKRKMKSESVNYTATVKI